MKDPNEIHQNGYTICGTPEYMPPEMLHGMGVGLSTDWWAFGCVIYEMLTGEPPFTSKNHNRQSIYKKIKYN